MQLRVSARRQDGIYRRRGRWRWRAVRKGKRDRNGPITLATIGLQVGVQEFGQLIFFKDKTALDHFKENKFEFTAKISAVIITAGASKGTDYRDGVVVFTHSNAGAMAEVALGTQKLSFKREGASAKK